MLGVGFSALCGRWYRVVRDLHHFFIAVSRAIVIDDCWDGTDIHMVVWAGEGGRYVRSRITPCFPALFRFGSLTGAAGDVRHWPCCWAPGEDVCFPVRRGGGGALAG